MLIYKFCDALASQAQERACVRKLTAMHSVIMSLLTAIARYNGWVPYDGNVLWNGWSQMMEYTITMHGIPEKVMAGHGGWMSRVSSVLWNEWAQTMEHLVGQAEAPEDATGEPPKRGLKRTVSATGSKTPGQGNKGSPRKRAADLKKTGAGTLVQRGTSDERPREGPVQVIVMEWSRDATAYWDRASAGEHLYQIQIVHNVQRSALHQTVLHVGNYLRQEHEADNELPENLAAMERDFKARLVINRDMTGMDGTTFKSWRVCWYVASPGFAELQGFIEWLDGYFVFRRETGRTEGMLDYHSQLWQERLSEFRFHR